MDITTPSSPTPASATTPSPNLNQSAESLPEWEVKLRKDLLEQSLQAALELEKMAIPPEKREEFAIGYADEKATAAVQKITEFVIKQDEAKAAFEKKLEKSKLDFIEKNNGVSEISSLTLLAYATRSSGISPRKPKDSKEASPGNPVVAPVEDAGESAETQGDSTQKSTDESVEAVAKLPESDNLPKPQAEEAAAGL